MNDHFARYVEGLMRLAGVPSPERPDPLTRFIALRRATGRVMSNPTGAVAVVEEFSIPATAHSGHTLACLSKSGAAFCPHCQTWFYPPTPVDRFTTLSRACDGCTQGGAR